MLARTHEGPASVAGPSSIYLLASNRRSRLSLTLERVVEHVLRDSFTEHGTVVARRTKVNAGEDAGILHVLQRLRKAAECLRGTPTRTSDLSVKRVLSPNSSARIAVAAPLMHEWPDG